MSTILSTRDGVKSRKPRRCTLCGERIEIGEAHNTRTGVDCGDIWTMRMHPVCEAYEQSPEMRANLDEWYEDVSDAAFTRAEALAHADKNKVVLPT